MWPLFVLFGLFAVAESSSSSSGGGASKPPPIDDDGNIHLTCDDAIALLPADLQKPVQDAINFSKSREALYALADSLEAGSKSPTVDDTTFAALVVTAHCVRAAADRLAGGVPLSSSASSASFAGAPEERTPSTLGRGAEYAREVA